MNTNLEMVIGESAVLVDFINTLPLSYNYKTTMTSGEHFDGVHKKLLVCFSNPLYMTNTYCFINYSKEHNYELLINTSCDRTTCKEYYNLTLSKLMEQILIHLDENYNYSNSLKVVSEPITVKLPFITEFGYHDFTLSNCKICDNIVTIDDEELLKSTMALSDSIFTELLKYLISIRADKNTVEFNIPIKYFTDITFGKK